VPRDFALLRNVQAGSEAPDFLPRGKAERGVMLITDLKLALKVAMPLLPPSCLQGLDIIKLSLNKILIVVPLAQNLQSNCKDITPIRHRPLGYKLFFFSLHNLCYHRRCITYGNGGVVKQTTKNPTPLHFQYITPTFYPSTTIFDNIQINQPTRCINLSD